MEADDGDEKREGGGVTTAFEDAWSKAGGYSAIGRDLLNHCARYFNNGGILDEFDRVIAEARARMVEAAIDPLPQGQSCPADLHQPVSEPGGQCICATPIVAAPSAREAIAGGGGHSTPEIQSTAAPVVQQPIPGEASQNSRDIPEAFARPVREPHSDPAGQAFRDAHMDVARGDRNQIADDGGHNGSIRKDHERLALTVREPSSAYLKAMGESRRQAARSILYRYRTSTGQWWGDVHPYEVGSMMRDSLRGQQLMSACGSLNPKQMKMTFAELLSPEQARIAMEKADKELIDAATV